MHRGGDLSPNLVSGPITAELDCDGLVGAGAVLSTGINGTSWRVSRRCDRRLSRFDGWMKALRCLGLMRDSRPIRKRQRHIREVIEYRDCVSNEIACSGTASTPTLLARSRIVRMERRKAAGRGVHCRVVPCSSSSISLGAVLGADAHHCMAWPQRKVRVRRQCACWVLVLSRVHDQCSVHAVLNRGVSGLQTLWLRTSLVAQQ